MNQFIVRVYARCRTCKNSMTVIKEYNSNKKRCRDCGKITIPSGTKVVRSTSA